MNLYLKCSIFVLIVVNSFVAVVLGCKHFKPCTRCDVYYERAPNDCTSFVLCRQGRPYPWFKCSTGLVWSTRLKACVWAYADYSDCLHTKGNKPEMKRPMPTLRPITKRPRPPPTYRPRYPKWYTTPRPVTIKSWFVKPVSTPKPRRIYPQRPVYSYDNKRCGIKSSLNIVGGRAAHPGEWPWQASLQIRDKYTRDYQHFCGAVLIEEYWVATAAHCVYGKRQSTLSVLFGAHHLNSLNGQEVRIGISTVIPHPYYVDSGNYPCDIALLRLSDPVELADGLVREVCLPSTTDEVVGECWVTGWGVTLEDDGDYLQELKSDVINNTYCKELWHGYIRDDHVCVGMGNTGACRGDSGGPLVCRKNGRYQLAGITSWGEETCTKKGYPNIFTRVSSFVDWIKHTMNANPL